MNYSISNTSELDLDQIKPLLNSFLPFARQEMGYDRPAAINFISDPKNADKTLGKTAFYDPNNDSISIYTDSRHPKDIMRSLSHELVHHAQNCRGDFDKKPEMGEGYFQNDRYMREMEREAYELGNMCFREWEEGFKEQLQESTYYNTGDIKMNHNEWKNRAIFGRLMENYGYGPLCEGDMIDDSAAEEAAEADEAAAETKPAVTALEEGEELDEGAGEDCQEDEVMEEAEMPMKPDTEEDLDNDGDTDDEVPAFLDETKLREAVRKAIKKANL